MKNCRHQWAFSVRPDVLECADCGATCTGVNLKLAVEQARWALRGGASFDRVALVHGRAVARMALIVNASAASPTPPAAPLRYGRRSH